MKPYRLINQSELKALTRHLLLTLEVWNKTYSTHPWTLSLDLPSQELSQASLCISDFAMIEANYLEAFNFVLFGELDPNFNNTSQQLASLLFKELFKTPYCNIQEAPPPNWQYKGSTCLLLRLMAYDLSLDLLLNPSWVYEQLPRIKTTSSALVPLETALESTKISLNLELQPIKLPINQLVNLQAGDVISLDHRLNTPLKLTKDKALIALGELGQTHLHKSILLKRSS